MSKYIKQNPRINRRILTLRSSLPESVHRTPVLHHDKRRARVVDGVSSTTGLWDEEIGEVPAVFDRMVHKLDLADSLLRRGESIKNANIVASSTQTTVQAE